MSIARRRSPPARPPAARQRHAATASSRAELLARLGLAVIAARHIADDGRRIALGWIAEAATTGRRDAHDVADADLDVLVLGEMRRPIGLAALAHLDGVGAAVLAA